MELFCLKFEVTKGKTEELVSWLLSPFIYFKNIKFWENREDLVRRLVKRFLCIKLLLWVPTPFWQKGRGVTPFTIISWGRFQGEGQLREFGNAFSALRTPRKLVPNSGLRKEAKVRWRLVYDSCLGNLQVRERQSYFGGRALSHGQGYMNFSHGPCCGVTFDIVYQQSHGDLSRKGLACTARCPELRRQQAKARVEMHLPGSRGVAETFGTLIKVPT